MSYLNHPLERAGGIAGIEQDIPEKKTTEGDEQTDDNGRRRRANGIGGLGDKETHGESSTMGREKERYESGVQDQKKIKTCTAVCQQRKIARETHDEGGEQKNPRSKSGNQPAK